MGGGMFDGIKHKQSPSMESSSDYNSSLSCSDSTIENISSVEPCILWVCILRNGTLLVKATAENKGPEVIGLVRSLLQRKVTTGWDTISDTTAAGPLAKYRGGYKGLQFHLLEEDATAAAATATAAAAGGSNNNEILVWTFACVYDSRLVRKEMAQAFVEQKLMFMTEGMRQVDKTWRNGSHLACQEEFGPILRQRLDEMSYQSGVSSVDDGLTLSNEAVQNNIAILKRYQETRNKSNHKVDNCESQDSGDKSGQSSPSSGIERERKRPLLFERWKERKSPSRPKPDDTPQGTSAPLEHVYIPTKDLLTKKHSSGPLRFFGGIFAATCIVAGAAILISHQLRSRPDIVSSFLSFSPISQS